MTNYAILWNSILHDKIWIFCSFLCVNWHLARLLIHNSHISRFDSSHKCKSVSNSIILRFSISFRPFLKSVVTLLKTFFSCKWFSYLDGLKYLHTFLTKDFSGSHQKLFFFFVDSERREWDKNDGLSIHVSIFFCHTKLPSNA